MKILVLVMLLISLAEICEAQIFAQKKEKRELLLQQIAALKVYTGYLQKGYTIAKEGINTINDIKNGDFDLHSIFFDSYKQVNPILFNYVKVPGTIQLVEDIEMTCGNAKNMIEKEANLTQEEKVYLNNVMNALLGKTSAALDQLTMITTDALLEMNDNQRMEWIDRIYKDVKDKHVFVQSFSKNIQLLSAQRIHIQTEINNSRVLNGLK